MAIVWKRIGVDSWRVVFKAVTLLEHLVKSGSEKVVEEARREQYLIRRLNDFRAVDETGVDRLVPFSSSRQSILNVGCALHFRGAGVRELSKRLGALLNDSRGLNKLRDETRRNRSKFQGIGASGFGSFGYQGDSGGYGAESSNRARVSDLTELGVCVGGVGVRQNWTELYKLTFCCSVCKWAVSNVIRLESPFAACALSLIVCPLTLLEEETQ